MSDDPGRWLDQEDLDPELRRALRAGKDEAPSEAQLASLAARLGPLMGPPGGSSGGGAEGGGGAGGGGAGGTGAAATKGGVSLAAKAMGGLMTAIAVTGVGLFMAAPDQVESPALRTPASTAEAAPTPPEAPEPEPEPAPEEIPEGIDAPAPEPEPAAPRRPAHENDPAAELALIREAQAALASSPAVALEHTAAHRRRFGDGSLAQEREVVAIDALVRLGREAEARARATRFRSRWPRSAHVRRLDVLAPP